MVNEDGDCLTLAISRGRTLYNGQSKNRRAVKTEEHSTIRYRLFVDGKTANMFQPDKVPLTSIVVRTSAGSIEEYLGFVQWTLDNAAVSEPSTEHEVR